MSGEKTFREKWLDSVERKNSVLCAGLDPAEFDMGRGEKGLPAGISKSDWARNYIEAVAPYSAAIKPNIQYWKDVGDMAGLKMVYEQAHDLGLVVIEDSKLADIGSTNDAGFFYGSQRADAITFSPFAGNLEEAVKQAHSRKIGIIGMCLMSNPEYERQKNSLVEVGEMDVPSYGPMDLFSVKQFSNSTERVKQYIQLAHDSNKFGMDGLVIGAPSSNNHIKSGEIETVRGYVSDNMLILLPGVGAQGGEAGEIWKYFGSKNVIVNVGRDLMLHYGSNSTPAQQAETAKDYRDKLNDLRRAA